MNSQHSLNTMRSTFFNLPSHLRVAAFNNAMFSSRSFSSTSRRDIDPVSSLTAAPIFLMDSLHSLGLSWATVIPCTALILRGGITYHFLMKPQRKMAQQRVAIIPLVHAWTIMYRERPEVQKQLAFYQRKRQSVNWNLYQAWVRRKASFLAWWNLGYLGGQGRWRTIGSPFINFGILITAMEAIRIKCGGKDGVLSLLLTPAKWVIEALEAEAPKNRTVKYDATTIGHAPPVQTMPETSATATANQNPVPEAVVPTENLSPINAGPVDTAASTGTPTTALSSSVDPNLQTEGPWFCPDLTAVDASGILSAGVFAAIAIPAIFSPQKPRPDLPTRFSSATNQDSNASSNNPSNILNFKPPPRSKLETMTGGSKFQLLFAVYILFASLKMPAGMLLYMIGSWSIGFVQRVWLDVKYPTVRPIAPCLRPVRQRQRRMW
jgi:mitochondrial inner membrane protein COX18